MCKITKDMVQKANEAVMHRKIDDKAVAAPEGFSVSTTYNGKVFHAHFSRQDIDSAYAAAYKKVMCG